MDIAVDLKGHTQNARPGILASRPAPCQVSYLGYPGTTGAPYIDYVIVDPFVVPGDQQAFYTENLVSLPDCYQVNDRKRPISPAPLKRTDVGLPDTAFVFCSFNNSYKITPDVFAVWMRLLQAVPTSVFWILSYNPWAVTNLRAAAGRHGTDPNRIIFAGALAHGAHLARMALADLFLDTFPYTAHTTASDALWAGLPLLTCAGQSFASRVAGSLLRTASLPEMVTTSLRDYEARARELALNPALLAGVRSTLRMRVRNSPLFDTPRFVRHIEAAYTRMFERHLAGLPPAPFQINTR